MHTRSALAWILGLSLCACGGGDGGGGGGTPVNLMNFQAAGDIIGQGAANGGSANNGGGATPNQVGLATPNGHVATGSLYVADRDNNRIMGWTSIPTGAGQLADFVIGQTSFTTATSGTTDTTVDSPVSCWVAGDALFVADANNARVLIYSPRPTSNLPASVALGQPGVMTSVAAVSQAGLDTPRDVCVAANRIVVADPGADRVMVWNGIPTTSGADAQLVLGQLTFTSQGAGSTATGLASPSGVWTDGTRLVVADSDNNRVLVWSTFPTVNGQAADLVVGQPDFNTVSAGAGSQKMNLPSSVVSDGTSLFVADRFNNRVLIFRPFPTSSNPAATGVLGQANFTNVTANDDDQNGVSDMTPSARTMSSPRGVATAGNKLLVTDGDNHRVLIFTGS